MNSKTQDLFSLGNADAWYFVTNTENLKGIIANGLIISPNGLKVYYEDTLNIHPGCVLIFRNKVPDWAIELCISEETHLTSVIIDIDIERTYGKIYHLSPGSNELVETKIQNVTQKDEYDILYLCAPQSISCINTIYYESVSDKNNFKKDASLFSDVLISNFDLKTKKTLFEKTTQLQKIDYSKVIFPEYSAVNYPKVLAYGGVLSNLFYFSKNGKISNDVYQQFCCLDNNISDHDNMIIEMIQYFYDDHNMKVISNTKKILYDILNIAIESDNFKNDVVNYFNEIDNENIKHRSSEIVKLLTEYETQPKWSPSVYFENAKTPLERLLLMLFLKENSNELVEYHIPNLKEIDYLIFAIVFGLRDKYNGVPTFVKEMKGVQAFITTMMSAFAHHITYSDMENAKDIIPVHIGKMFSNESFKKWYAKIHNINCFKTTIQFPKGQYSVNTLSTGLTIEYAGIVKNIQIDIDNERYFNGILYHRIDDYDKMLAKYEGENK